MQQFLATFGFGIALVVLGSLLAGIAAAVPGDRIGSLRGSLRAVATVMLTTGAAMCMLPGVVGSLVGLMIGLATAIAIYQRGVGERAALNDAISLAASRGIPLDRLGFAFALGRRDRLGERAYRFAQYIQAGFAADQAAVTAGLSLTPDLRSRLARLDPAAVPPSGPTDHLTTGRPTDRPTEPVAARAFSPESPWGVDEMASPSWLVGGLYLMILIWFATTVVTIVVVPTMNSLFDEFALATPGWLTLVEVGIAILPLLSLVVLLAFCVLSVLWLMMHAGVLSGGFWFPILGPYYRSRYDAQALEWLARGIAAGESLDELEQQLRRTRIGPSESRLWKAMKLVREGAEWPLALRGASLISRGALPWLAVAHGGEHLARALDEVAATRRRHSIDRLKMGLRIAGPVGVAIAAFPILLCGLLLIGMLSQMVQEFA